MILDKLLKGHGALPLTAIPPAILSHVLSTHTSLPDVIAAPGIPPSSSILVLSAMNTAWPGYVLPVTVFKIRYWEWKKLWAHTKKGR